MATIFSGHHICRMNIARMIHFHMSKHAEVTVAVTECCVNHALRVSGLEGFLLDGNYFFFSERR